MYFRPDSEKEPFKLFETKYANPKVTIVRSLIIIIFLFFMVRALALATGHLVFGEIPFVDQMLKEVLDFYHWNIEPELFG